jgi:hypothetical protein
MFLSTRLTKFGCSLEGSQRNYENSLSAIDSILGVSRVVDTKFTKKYGIARMKVAVLNPDLIQDLVDVVIGDFVYELQFRVQKDMLDGVPQVIDMDSTMDKDKHPEEETEDMDEDGNKTADAPAG